MKCFRKSFVWLLLAVFVVSAMPVESFARRSSFSSSRSSFSSSRSSWSSSSRSSYRSSSTASRSVFSSRSGGGYFRSKPKTSSSSTKTVSKKTTLNSKPSKAKATTSATKVAAKSANGFSSSKATSKPKATVKKSAPMGSKLDKKVGAKSKKKDGKAALARYRADKVKYKKPAKPVSTAAYRTKYKNNSTVKRAAKVSSRDYYRRRNAYYTTHHWNPPVYVYNSYSHFGVYDSWFMWMMLDNMHDRQYSRMMHHRYNDPGFQQWRNEANRLAADNAELKAKMAKMDAELATIKEPRDPDFIAEGIDPAIMVSREVMEPALRLATASKDGNYHYFGKQMAGAVDDVEVSPVATSGSMENLKLLKQGKVDAAVIQSDAFPVFNALAKKNGNRSFRMPTEQAELHLEAVQLIAHRESGVDTISDLDPEKHIVMFPRGSGAALTWKGLCLMDSDYEKVRTIGMPYNKALEQALMNPNALILTVSGLNSGFMKKAERVAKDKLRLVAVNDFGMFDLNDVKDAHGNEVYSTVEIPAGVYPNLQAGTYFGTNDTETLAVKAIFTVRSEWIDENSMEAMDNVSFGVMDAQPKVAALVAGLEED